MTAPQPLLQIRGLGFSRDARPVLQDLALDLAPGQRMGLIGANGAGKTTLLRLIVGLDRPATGAICHQGQPCRNEADFRRHRPQIGYLFQDPDDQLFSPTVREDVAFGPLNQGLGQAAAFARADAQLAAFGLAALAERPVHRLSGGEKRLVCLAGLFAMHPQLLLLDEPSNGLDDSARARMIAQLQGFGGAMIIASHDGALLQALHAAPRLLAQGRLQGADPRA